MDIYHRVKALVPDIAYIATDANSCYQLAFTRNHIPKPHIITKTETHLIESSNSSIRDNLARFKRKSKQHSKSIHMLIITLQLFFNYYP